MELNVDSVKIQHEEITEEVEKKVNNDLCKYSGIFATLPSCKGWCEEDKMLRYGNFWYASEILSSILAIQETFKPLSSDLFVVTYPKSGTTWIKALVFAIVNRTLFAFDQHHPLLSSSPHDCVPFLEEIYMQKDGEFINSGDTSSPRLFGMHSPYSALPSSMKNSDCRIVYLCRDPKDTFISLYYFVSKVSNSAVVSFNEAFELFCEGQTYEGPIWDHILEYWTESLRQPEKVLFLKYEELKADPLKNVIKLAEFTGYPFTEEEVQKGVVEEIIKLCSFEKLSKVEANKNGSHTTQGSVPFENSAFFRKGKVGDWKEHLSPEMAQKLDDITEKKLKRSGLKFLY